MSASPISKGLLQSNLRRFWPLWLAFAVAWFLGLILPLAIIVPSAGEDALSFMSAGWTAEYVACLIGCTVASMVTVNFLFEYLTDQRSATFYGSLPIKRSTLFLSTYVSGLLPLVVIEVIVACVLMVLSGIYPAIEAACVWSWAGLALGSTFIFYSLAAFCAVLTGTRSIATILFALANFFIVLMEWFLRAISSMTLWGVSLTGSFKTLWTSPFLGLWNYCINGGQSVVVAESMNFVPLAAYCLVALALVCASLALNSRRHLEYAGAAIAFGGVRIVCKYIAGICGVFFCGLLILLFVEMPVSEGGVLTLGQSALLVVFMAFGGFLGLFFAEIVLSKSRRVVGECWKGAIVLAVVSIAFVSGCSMDVLNVASYTPKVADVESVELSGGVTLRQEDSIEQAISVHQEVIDYGWHSYGSNAQGETLDFTYTLLDGTKVTRSYKVYELENYENPSSAIPEGKSLVQDYASILNCTEGVESRFRIFEDKPAGDVTVSICKSTDEYDVDVAYLNVSDVDDFVSGPLMEDVQESGLGMVSFGSASYLDSGEEDLDFYLELDYEGDGSSEYVTVYLTKSNCPNVAKWLKTHYKVDLS